MKQMDKQIDTLIIFDADFASMQNGLVPKIKTWLVINNT